MNRKYSMPTTEAISSLVAKEPFYASLLFDLLEIKEDDTIPTAATDGRSILLGKWFRELPVKERVFVLAHEITHVILRHPGRMKQYAERGVGPDMRPWDGQKWNRATDYIINDLLKATGVGIIPSVGLHNPQYPHTELAEDVYNKLPLDPGRNSMDQHLTPQSGAGQPSSQQVKRAVVAAREAARSVGKLHAALDRFVGGLMEPVQPWKEILHDYVTSTVGREDVSWARPNRRRLALPPHVPFPGTDGAAMGTMVVAIDTSGSISEETLTEFVSEMAGILEQVRPRELYVCWWDTEAKIEEVEDLADIEAMRAFGGGGTDWDCVPKAIEDEMIDPEIVVTLSDNWISCSYTDVGFNHLSVSTTDREFPFGKTIRLSPHEKT